MTATPGMTSLPESESPLAVGLPSKSNQNQITCRLIAEITTDYSIVRCYAVLCMCSTSNNAPLVPSVEVP